MDSNIFAKYGATVTPKPVVNDSIFSKYGATPVIPSAPPEQPGFFNQIGTTAVNETAQGFKSAYDNAKKDFSAGTVSGGILGVSDIIGGLFAPISASVNAVTGGAIPKTVNAVGNKITDSLSPEGIKAMNVINDLFDKNPDAKRLLFEAAPNFVNAATLGVGGGEAKIGNPAEVIKGTAADIRTGAGAVSKVAGQATDAVVGKLQDRYVGKTIEDWNRVGGDYVKTDKLLAQEEARASGNNVPTSVQDTPTFLSQHGIAPDALIQDGKFQTNDVATKLTTEAVKPFEDTLTSQLKVVQQGQPLTQISELRPQLMNALDRIKGQTPDVAEEMVKVAENKLGALERKYPNGIPLDQLNVEKGNFWRGTKFDLNKPLDPQVNYQIGTAMKDLIEAKAGDANVSELNGLLGNYYKAGKFLRGLDNRVPKLTAGQKFGRAVVKTATFGVGEKLFGISGGVGGLLLSKSISHFLENASNPVRGMILRGLEKTNPAAYKSAIQWLGQQEAIRLSRLALPSPNTEGGVTTPRVITPSSPTTFERASVSSKLTSVNPKTGTQYVRDLNTGKKQIINK